MHSYQFTFLVADDPRDIAEWSNAVFERRTVGVSAHADEVRQRCGLRPGRKRGIDAKQSAGEIRRPEGIREPARVPECSGLPVTTDVDNVGIGWVGDNGEVNRPLPASNLFWRRPRSRPLRIGANPDVRSVFIGARHV